MTQEKKDDVLIYFFVKSSPLKTVAQTAEHFDIPIEEVYKILEENNDARTKS